MSIRLGPFLGSSPIPPFLYRWGGQGLFTVGILLYFSIHLGVIQLPLIVERSVPPEPDDAYSYILKSPQMHSCFWQDCPAIEDLRRQLSSPSSDPQIIWERDRQYQRTLLVYHPLYSILLLGFHWIGFSWENAYNALTITGIIFVGFATSYWLYSIFGYGLSGIAMIILAFTFFSSQGPYFITPSRLVLGIAMLTWGMVAQARKSLRWVLPLCILAMITMHPMGKVYAIVTLIAYVQYPSLSKHTWLILGISLFLIVGSFVLPVVVTRPVLLLSPKFQAESLWKEYLINLDTAILLIRKWADHFRGGILTVAIVVLIGFLSPCLERKRKILIMGGVMGLLFGGGLLYVYPGYPAVMVPRVWVPILIFFTGIIAQAAWGVLGFTRLLHTDASHMQNVVNPSLLEVRWKRFGRNVTIMLLLIFIVRFGQYAVTGYFKFQKLVRSRISNTNIALDVEQPALLLSNDHRCRSVVYLSETPLYFFLSHGASQCGAVFYRAVAGTAEETAWITENKDISHLVAWSPVMMLSVGQQGGISLMPGDQFTFHNTRSKYSNTVYFYLENRGEETVLDVQLTDPSLSEPNMIQLQVPAEWSGWLPYPLKDTAGVSTLRLEIVNAEETILLKGFRSDRHSSLNWPWDQGITLTYMPADTESKSHSIDFTSATLSPLVDRSVHVIADGGSTILADVVNY